MYHQVLLVLLLHAIIIPLAETFEASEVEALFSAPAPDDEYIDEVLTEPATHEASSADGVKLKESPSEESSTDEASKQPGNPINSEDDEQKQSKNQGDDSVEASTESELPPDSVIVTTEGPQRTYDLSDRRGWHVPMTGGDVIPPAIIPPEPEDTVNEEELNGDKISVATGDVRNWYVAHSVGDIMPAAIIPQEDDQNQTNGKENSKNTENGTATKTDKGSGATGSYLALVVLPLALMIHF
ncbi:unnamed protein product [Anisakis simplex]|uniref:Secreted protein n=1 Tax=Anisakis simplex TaxID=6269 RepID=A0A0M3JV54_ANISI|nr:unnamed protein product [Anisakis simplex]